MGNIIRTAEKITLDDLKNIFSEKIECIKIPNFFPGDLCSIISQKILGRSDKGCFNKANEIGRIGLAHFEIDTIERFNEYHNNAINNIDRLRKIFNPYLSPVDHLRLILDEIWPSGAKLETLYGRKCFIGICRIIDQSVQLLAHNDRLDRDSPDSIQAASLVKQLSANIYIQTPYTCGELALWKKEPKNEDEYKKMKNGKYGIETKLLGAPDVIIAPRSGELVIFNARRYHAVYQGNGRSRINVGMFIGYRGEHTSLSYWS